MKRRDVLTGLAVAVPAASIGLQPAQALAQMANAGGPQQNGRIETVSGHSPFTLPRDHKFHGGGIYDTGDLEEWHYWTGFFKDDQTGEEFGLFYCWFHAGTAPRDSLSSSIGNLNTKEFVWLAKGLPDLVADAPAGSNSADDFQYTCGTPNAETYCRTIYRAAADTWSIQCRTVATSPAVRYEMDLKLHTTTPYGYLLVTPTGMEMENTPWTGKSDAEIMRSVSYYYAGPKTAAKGTITVGGRVRRVTGSLWFEHQWGNFAFAKMPWASAYVWSAWQFDDGSIFTFRQWTDAQGKSLLDLGRHSYSKPDGTTTYGYGASVVWEGLKTWKSPVSGHVFPTQGRVTSPYGTWYYTAVFNPYEMPRGFKPYGEGGSTLFEGPVWIRRDSLEGPIIGRAYLELPNDLTKVFPEMK